MDYKIKYNDALEGIRELYNSDCDMIRVKRLRRRFEHIFPELKESEDERIRKGLIKSVSRIFEGHKLFDTDVTREEALAWLEKQGEQHSPIDINKMVDDFAHTEVKGYGIPSMVEVDAYRKGIEDVLEMRSEQMTKPKFKVRDWIVDDKTPNDAFYVIEVLEEIYKVIDNEGDDYHIPHSKADKQFHLWTIDDAKKGDILVVDGTWIVEFDKKMTDGCQWKDTSILTSFEYDMDDDIYTTGSHMFYEDIWPASKEDIDLFKKKRNQYLASNPHNESKFKVGDRVVINCREEFAAAYNGKEGTIINIFDLEKNHWGNIVVVLDNGMRNTFYTSELIKK